MEALTNWKIILIGGIVFYAVTWTISMLTCPFIHEGFMTSLYESTASFWRPELTQDPPDMAALMPRWIASGLVTSFIFAGVYGSIRSALDGPAWKKGLTFGVILTLIGASFNLQMSGFFNLPDDIWMWWCIELPAYYLPSGIALGWLAEKLVPEAAG